VTALVNEHLGERHDFIKKYEATVIDVSGRQIMLEKDQEGLKEIDRQNDFKLNGLQVMVESLQFELDKTKQRHTDMRQQFQQDLEAVKKQVTDATKGIRAAGIINKKMQQAQEETEKKEEGKML
jgi:Ni,Fe-hydrogenase I large subunit